MKYRVLALCLAAVLVLTAFWPMPVSAEYENTYTNTGDQRADIIGVALTQVGYAERSDRSTKYGEWYGYPTADWCGIFISWCAEQAGVPTSVIKKNGWANPSGFGFSTYYDCTQYTPRPGDLFFKKSFSHAGIVYYVDGDYFYTLEGNTWYNGSPHSVMTRKRALNEFYFVSPNYNGTGADIPIPSTPPTNPTPPPTTAPACSHKWKDNGIVKEAGCTTSGSQSQICEKCSAKRTVSISAIGHKYGEWIELDEKQHQRICENCEKVEKKDHDKMDWQSDEAGHWKSCDTCGGHIQMEAHDIQGECGSECSVCKYASPSGHNYGPWQMDGTGHWRVCKTCEHKEELQSHNYLTQCAQTCQDCGYERAVSHTFEQKADLTGHWKVCSVCGLEDEKKVHIPGPEATEKEPQICLKCDFELVPKLEHVHTFRYVSDQLVHWGTCECGYTEDPQGHSWSLENASCSVCGAEAPKNQEQTDWDKVWYIGGSALVLVTVLTIVLIPVVRKKKD